MVDFVKLIPRDDQRVFAAEEAAARTCVPPWVTHSLQPELVFVDRPKARSSTSHFGRVVHTLGAHKMLPRLCWAALCRAALCRADLCRAALCRAVFLLADGLLRASAFADRRAPGALHHGVPFEAAAQPIPLVYNAHTYLYSLAVPQDEFKTMANGRGAD